MKAKELAQLLELVVRKVVKEELKPILKEIKQSSKPIIKEHDGIKVVRDDLLDGGTKRRAFNVFVESFPDVQEWVYASPREGYAQLSLAYACHDLGKKATVTVPKGKHNWLTTEAIRLGCNIIEVPMGYLTNIQAKARYYVEENEGAQLIPFGGDHPIIIDAMRNAALSLDIEPPKDFKVIYINDDKTTFEFVSESLINIFDYQEPDANLKTVEIHEAGSSVVAVLPFEIAEQKGVEVLLEARKQGYPLEVKLETE